MFSGKTPLGLRKQARQSRSRSRSRSRRDNKHPPVLSTNEDDDDSKLLVSSKVLSTGNSHYSGQEAIPNWRLTSDTSPLKKKRSFKDVLFTRSRSLTRSLSLTKNKETHVYEYYDTKPKERRSRSWTRSWSRSRSLKEDKELAISDEHKGSLIFKDEEASKTLSQRIPLEKKESLKDRLAISAPQEPSVPPPVKADPNNPSQSDAPPMPLKKTRSLKTLLKKKESLKDRLAISAPQEPSVSPTVKAEPNNPSQSDAPPMPLKKTRSLKGRLLVRPPSFTKELDSSMTPVQAPKSPPRSYGQPRITIIDGSQQSVEPAVLVQLQGVNKLASSQKQPPPPPPPLSRESPSSDDDDDDDESCRYAVPESYSLRRSPVTREKNDKPESDRFVEERHWGSKSVLPRYWSRLSDAHSESTWIPTEDERYKLASVFIFGEEEADNASVESRSAYTDRTGITGTTDGDTSIFSESTGVNTGIFTGFTDYSEGTGVTSKTSVTGYTGATSRTSVTGYTGATGKTSVTGYTGATSKTSVTGYTTGSGDTSESSDTVSSFSDDKSFPSMSTKSPITTMTGETSLFDLDVDHVDTPIKKRARNKKRHKQPKKKNFFLETMLDLLSLAEEMSDERDGCRRGFPCMGYHD